MKKNFVNVNLVDIKGIKFQRELGEAKNLAISVKNIKMRLWETWSSSQLLH